MRLARSDPKQGYTIRAPRRRFSRGGKSVMSRLCRLLLLWLARIKRKVALMDWLEIFLPSAIAALKKAINTPKSKAARKLRDKVVLLRDACDQFLSVFEE
jgi:hypothetical protein